MVYGTLEDIGGLPKKVTIVEMQPEAILGMDTMTKLGVNVNFMRKELEVEDEAQRPEDRSSRKTEPLKGKTGCAAYTDEMAGEKKWKTRNVGDALWKIQ